MKTGMPQAGGCAEGCLPVDVVRPPLAISRTLAQALGALAVIALTVWSATLAKQMRGLPMAEVERTQAVETLPASFAPIDQDEIVADAPEAIVTDEPAEVVVAEPARALDPLAFDPRVRWFNARPVRPVTRMWMTVTAYSPDHRSCGDSADGITATLHSVTTNGHALVAADPRVLPYGSMITVPGYDVSKATGESQIVPVLDCGGAIKGRRLDVLFPTHEQARKWGTRRLLVTVWGYADGSPRDNPRKLR